MSLDDSRPKRQAWFALKTRHPNPKNWPREALADDSVRTLRALSQTCRALRVHALPLLWNIVHIATLDELLRLRETLRASPDIAQHIRTFCFVMVSEDALCERCTESKRDVFVEAVDNAWLMSRLRKEQTGQPSRDEGLGPPPGRAAPCNVCPLRARNLTSQQRAQREEMLDACLVDVVQQLTSLTTFGWCTAALPMALGVCAALSELSALSSAHVNMLTLRRSPEVGE